MFSKESIYDLIIVRRCVMTTFSISKGRGKLSSLQSKQEEKRRQKPTGGVGRKKGGDQSLKRNGR